MKKKKEAEIIFNPADYAYMDDMPLEGWVWEFERRSEDYKKAFVELNECGKTSIEGLQFLETCNFDPSKRWCEVDQVKAGLSRANPVQIVNLKWGHDIPSEDSEPFTYKDAQFKAEAGKVTVTYSSRHSHPLDTLRHQMGKEFIVMALINLDANNKKIIPLVGDALDEWRKALKIKTKKLPRKQQDSPMWKSWLMVYDIKTANHKLKYPAIGRELEKYFENHYEYTLSRNIGNYFNEAEKMIDGGYRNLL
jgi:hypothetical protein